MEADQLSRRAGIAAVPPDADQAAAAPGRPAPLRWMTFLVIGSTCFAQMFPLNLSDRVMTTVARANDVPLASFWLFSLLSIPAWAKLLWAPLVDRAGSARWGRRRSVIIPATLLAAASLLVLGAVEPTPATFGLAIGIKLVHTLIMTTQDIAVDAYTVEALRPHERPIGAMFKSGFVGAGSLVSASVVLWAYSNWGWSAAMAVAAGVLVLFSLPVAWRPEDPPPANRAPASLLQFVRRRDLPLTGPLLVVGGAADMGLLIVGSAFFVDRGYSLAEVGLLVGVVYSAAELCGTLAISAGAAVLGLRRALAAAALLSVPALAPLALVGAQSNAGFAAAAIGVFLAALLSGALRDGFFIARLGWSAGPQAGTDFTGFGAFYNIGRTLGAAASAALFIAVGATAYFAGFGLLLAATFGAFAYLYPRASALGPSR